MASDKSREDGTGSCISIDELALRVREGDTAEREKTRFGMNQKEMTLLLMIHGILHLIGYDHEGSGKRAGEMARRQKGLFRKVLRRHVPTSDASPERRLARGIRLQINVGLRSRGSSEPIA